MSRVSLNKRLAVVRDTLLPPGSMAYRLYKLKPLELQQYNEWRDRCEKWYSAIEAEHGEGAAYEMYLTSQEEGSNRAWEPPELMPLALRWKLFPPDETVRSGDPESDYRDMIERP